MLPKLRIILAAVLATCAAVLALSAGMLGARLPGNDLNGVPQVGRTLVRQATVAEPEQQSQLLAYSRRADELLRLRDLPLTPARAVVDYAEQAKARAAETASALAAPAALPSAESAAAASEPSATAAPTANASAEAPAPPASESAAAPPTETAPPSTLAMAPVATPHRDTAAATVVERPASISPAPAETPAAAAAPSVDIKVSAVQTGGETTELYGPPQPKADGKPRHRPKVARPKPKKKPQVAVAPPRVAPTAPSPSTPSPGFSANDPYNHNNTFGSWPATTTQRGNSVPRAKPAG